ncbi:glutamyl-tRNA reductase [Robiginitalea sp. IMCC43444]|uniref:glutamyl-tRNA reductase n=1 Tax=Robiginitalea sp. IMCC43444 TaxID=3459121 RepID=UPI004041866F
MSKSVHFISISHQTATIQVREQFFVPEEEKLELMGHIQELFPDISGLFLLVTCNRTEFYFESETTKAAEVRDFFVESRGVSDPEASKSLFQQGDDTMDVVRHLLEVSSGLSSQVLGDAEILNQIKKAFQLSMSQNLQGSLLERAMQSVFKCHKRISNETTFRNGTTSMAYKSLKVVRDHFNRLSSRRPVRILLIGTGDIARQLLKYNNSFGFSEIYLSNRTQKNAQKLADKFHLKLYPWEKVLSNTFDGFDVIISAVSNQHHLIHSINPNTDKRLLIDLALPANIDSNLKRVSGLSLYDLDSLSVDLQQTKEKRRAAIRSVEGIIEQALQEYNNWFREAPLRAVLGQYKLLLESRLEEYLHATSEKEAVKRVSAESDRLMRKLIKYPHKEVRPKLIDQLIANEVEL